MGRESVIFTKIARATEARMCIRILTMIDPKEAAPQTIVPKSRKSCPWYLCALPIFNAGAMQKLNCVKKVISTDMPLVHGFCVYNAIEVKYTC
jgi:hypothetical protein